MKTPDQGGSLKNRKNLSNPGGPFQCVADVLILFSSGAVCHSPDGRERSGAPLLQVGRGKKVKALPLVFDKLRLLRPTQTESRQRCPTYIFAILTAVKSSFRAI